MLSEWMKVMLEEIELKKAQERQAQLEAELREREANPAAPPPARDEARRAAG